MDRTAQCSRLCLVFLLTLLLVVGAVVAEDRTSSSADTHVAKLPSFFDYFFGGEHAGGQRTDKALRTGRTFGAHKRLQFMIMPMVYKMGVMMTMLAVLTVISLKGLMIGMILLVLKLSAIFGKLYAGWHTGGGGHSSVGWAPPPQPVHVHLHNSGGSPSSGWSPHGQPAYGGWETAASGPPDEHYYYKG